MSHLPCTDAIGVVMTPVLVRELLRHFLRVGGYGGPEPRIYLRDATQIGRVARRHKIPPAGHRDFAITLHGGQMKPRIWINLARHTTLAELIDTCAHEAAHLVADVHRHTERFHTTHRALLSGKMP